MKWLFLRATGSADLTTTVRRSPRRLLGALSCAVLIALAGAGTAAAQPGPFGAPPAGPTAVHTNRAGFRIPYQYDPHEIARLGAREIRLFKSLDQGARWEHVQSVAPAAGRFDFQANRDGEYWFAVRTLDSQGQLHPGGDASPGLVVVVDTQNPKLTVDLRETSPGKVELSWSALDPNLAVETLRLEFTQAGISDWQSVGAAPQASGQTSWSVAAGGVVGVRGQVQDKAGNVARAQYQIQVRPAFPGNNTNVNPINPNAAPAPPPPGPVARLPQPTSTSGSNPFAQLFGNSGGSTNHQPVPAPAFGPTASTQPFGSPFDQPTQKAPSSFSGNDLFNSIPPAPAPGRDLAATPSPTGMPQTSGLPSQWQSNDTSAQFRPVSDRGGYRNVSSRRFHIDYRIDDIGPSGVAAVELYVTQNDGQKWFRYGVDEDRRSPFEIEVPADGMYGFVIRVVSGAGLSDPPPQPSQKPDIVVVVDSSPPVVQLFPLRQGQGRESSRILITWQAADQQLADTPIALSYSANQNGPWEPITQGWQPNTGTYVWNVGPNVPPRLFVRLIARDTAGNLAKVDTPQPVLVDLAKPTARIVDVESNQNQQRGAY